MHSLGARLWAGLRAVAGPRVGLVLVCFALLCAACTRREKSVPAATPVVEAPADLWLEGRLRQPDGAWQASQRGVGGLLTFLPSTAYGVLAVLGSLEVGVAELADGKRPAAVLVAGSLLSPSWVIVGQATERRLVEAKFPSRGAPRALPVGEIQLERLPLEPGPLQKSAFVVYLSSRGDLVIASHEAAAERLAPYALFGVLGRPSAAHDVELTVREAAMPLLAEGVRMGWARVQQTLLEKDAEARRARGGRAPDYGDPLAVVAAAQGGIKQLGSWLDDVREAQLLLDVEAEGVRLEMRADSRGAALAQSLRGMAHGAGGALAGEPASAQLSWLSYGDKAARGARGRAFGETSAEVFKGRVHADTQAALPSLLKDVGESAPLAWQLRFELESGRLSSLGRPENLTAHRAAWTQLLRLLEREPKLREMLQIAKVEGPQALRLGEGNTDSVPPQRFVFKRPDGGQKQVLLREATGRFALSYEELPRAELLSEVRGDAPWREASRPLLARALQELGEQSLFLVMSPPQAPGDSDEPPALVLGVAGQEAEGERPAALKARMWMPYRFARALPGLLRGVAW